MRFDDFDNETKYRIYESSRNNLILRMNEDGPAPGNYDDNCANLVGMIEQKMDALGLGMPPAIDNRPLENQTPVTIDFTIAGNENLKYENKSKHEIEKMEQEEKVEELQKQLNAARAANPVSPTQQAIDDLKDKLEKSKEKLKTCNLYKKGAYGNLKQCNLIRTKNAEQLENALIDVAKYHDIIDTLKNERYISSADFEDEDKKILSGQGLQKLKDEYLTRPLLKKHGLDSADWKPATNADLNNIHLKLDTLKKLVPENKNLVQHFQNLTEFYEFLRKKYPNELSIAPEKGEYAAFLSNFAKKNDTAAITEINAKMKELELLQSSFHDIKTMLNVESNSDVVATLRKRVETYENVQKSLLENNVITSDDVDESGIIKEESLGRLQTNYANYTKATAAITSLTSLIDGNFEKNIDGIIPYFTALKQQFLNQANEPVYKRFNPFGSRSQTPAPIPTGTTEINSALNSLKSELNIKDEDDVRAIKKKLDTYTDIIDSLIANGFINDDGISENGIITDEALSMFKVEYIEDPTTRIADDTPLTTFDNKKAMEAINNLINIIPSEYAITNPHLMVEYFKTVNESDDIFQELIPDNQVSDEIAEKINKKWDDFDELVENDNTSGSTFNEEMRSYERAKNERLAAIKETDEIQTQLEELAESTTSEIQELNNEIKELQKLLTDHDNNCQAFVNGVIRAFDNILEHIDSLIVGEEEVLLSQESTSFLEEATRISDHVNNIKDHIKSNNQMGAENAKDALHAEKDAHIKELEKNNEVLKNLIKAQNSSLRGQKKKAGNESEQIKELQDKLNRLVTQDKMYHFYDQVNGEDKGPDVHYGYIYWEKYIQNTEGGDDKLQVKNAKEFCDRLVKMYMDPMPLSKKTADTIRYLATKGPDSGINEKFGKLWDENGELQLAATNGNLNATDYGIIKKGGIIDGKMDGKVPSKALDRYSEEKKAQFKSDFEKIKVAEFNSTAQTDVYKEFQIKWKTKVLVPLFSKEEEEEEEEEEAGSDNGLVGDKAGSDDGLGGDEAGNVTLTFEQEIDAASDIDFEE